MTLLVVSSVCHEVPTERRFQVQNEDVTNYWTPKSRHRNDTPNPEREIR